MRHRRGRAVYSREKIKETLNISHQIKLRSTDIVFAWIPAHVPIPGNEEDDPLARSIVTASTSPQETPHIVNQIKECDEIPLFKIMGRNV